MTTQILVEIFDAGPIGGDLFDSPCPDPDQVILEQELRRIHREYGDGATVRRYWFGQDPRSYAAHPQVAALLRERGAGVLPVVMVDGWVMRTGSYPGLGEIEPHPAEVIEFEFFD